MTEGQAVDKQRSKSIYVMWGVALTLLLATGLLCWLMAERNHKPSFRTLQEALSFITDCLDTDDYDRLSGACAGGDRRPPDPEHERSVFDMLKAQHQKTPLTRLYAGKAFPVKETRFKLGGHGKELGHIHINFVKKGRVWVLKDIRVCQ